MKSVKLLAVNRGSLLIELCIAVALYSIIFSSLMLALFSKYDFVQDLVQRKHALFEAQEHMASTTINYITPCVAIASSSVSWHSSTKEKTISFSKYISDVDYARAIDGDCGGTLPKMSLSTSSPVSLKTFPLVGSSTALDVINDTIFITANTNGTSTLYIYSVTPDSILKLLSSIELQQSVTALDATQNKLFVAMQGTGNQCAIIDISNLNSPYVVGYYTLPNVAGEYPGATSIFYYDNKIFVGTHRTAGREFHIFDTHGSEARWLGSLEVNHNINALSIRENYAYLATSGNTKDFIVVDIKNPSAMYIASSFDIQGSEDALSLFMLGTNAFIGRKKSTKGYPNIVTVSVENPLIPQIISSTISNKNITSIKAFGENIFTGIDVSEHIVDIDFEHDTLFTLTEHELYVTTY